MKFSVITLFPEFFVSPLSTSLIGKAKDAGVLVFDFINPREFGEGKHRCVDDRPYGGGPGMVLMAPVLEKAVAKAVESDQTKQAHIIPWVVFLSPQGKKLTAAYARELSKKKHLVLICGHYEGVDERAITTLAFDEISIGDYVITGGEAAAVVLMDAVSRFIPGVVGDGLSVDADTFEAESKEKVEGGLKAPVYTRPRVFRDMPVPEVLLSGNHEAIAKWRKEESFKRTKKARS